MNFCRGAAVLCTMIALLPASAAQPAHPDLSGFFTLANDRFVPDP